MLYLKQDYPLVSPNLLCVAHLTQLVHVTQDDQDIIFIDLS